jgi:hypothetical protein
VNALDSTGGCIAIGSLADQQDPYNSTIAPVVLAAGQTILTQPIDAPRGTGAVSFEIHATSAGPCTLTCKVRTANRSAATLIDRGLTSPSALAAFSGSASAIMSIGNDCNFLQLEIACTGADCTVYAIGAAQQFPASEPITLGAVTLAAGSAVIGHTIVDSSGLPTGAATAAKQPALGTAGTPSVDVISVQGAASMKELLVQLVAGTAAIGKLAANAGVDIGAVEEVMPTAVFHGKTTVTTAATRVALASNQVIAKSVCITALLTNTGLIYVGGSTVAAANGFQLAPGQTTGWFPIANLATIDIDSSVNGEGVTYLAT